MLIGYVLTLELSSSDIGAPNNSCLRFAYPRFKNEEKTVNWCETLCEVSTASV